MTSTDYVIVHISDLHFSQGTDKSNPDHAHSIDHLIGLERRIPPSNDCDLLVVSGDVSNHGDKQSLINASGYIFDTIPIGGEEYAGLRFPSGKTGIVPGNHDAWNAQHSGTLIDRRQKSLENYNFAFKSHQIPGTTGCYYDWLQKDGEGIYLAFVDSCFLGDTEDNEDSAFGNIRYHEAIAKGKLTAQQTEKLLEWHDLGVKGNLENRRYKGNFIDKAAFSRSLKVLVMHHYLFEPPQHSSDYFMRVHHRDVVFRNIAFSDFDVLLCGHKHIPAFDVHTYGNHFDGRALNRYLINYFRRLIGLHSLPIQFEDNKGKRWAKKLSFVTNMLLKMVLRKKPEANATAIAANVLSLLRRGLEEPDALERNVKKFLHEQGLSGAEVLEGGELKEIQKRIAIGLSVQERKQLSTVAEKITNTWKNLKARPFLQAMSGSSAKACGHANRQRTFNIYRISHLNQKWTVRCERYSWDWGTREYSNQPLVQEQAFDKAIFTATYPITPADPL